MENTIKLNDEKYRFYIFENEGCLKLLKFHEAEIIECKIMVDVLFDKIKSNVFETKHEIDTLYKTSIAKLKLEIQNTIDIMEIQLKRIENDLILEMENDIEGYMIQDILRDKVKQLEIFYIDFKYKLMVYLSSYH